MNTVTSATDTQSPHRTEVDPRLPRFGQAITATGLFAGIVLNTPALVYLITVAVGIPVLTRWRIDPYAILWRHLVRPVVDPAEREPAAPHRFAKLIGAVGTTIASALLLAGMPTPAYVIAAGIGVAAGLAATTGICIGCRMYRSASLFQRLDIV